MFEFVLCVFCNLWQRGGHFYNYQTTYYVQNPTQRKHARLTYPSTPKHAYLELNLIIWVGSWRCMRCEQAATTEHILTALSRACQNLNKIITHHPKSTGARLDAMLNNRILTTTSKTPDANLWNVRGVFSFCLPLSPPLQCSAKLLVLCGMPSGGTQTNETWESENSQRVRNTNIALFRVNGWRVWHVA